MSYGILTNNEHTTKAFDEGYTALNFIGAGITRRHNGYITRLDFSCPTRPVLFYRGAEENVLTAPHYVVDYGNGNYRAYVLGSAEVFVFSTAVIPSNEPYGIQIYGKHGNLVYQSADEPITPFAHVTFPGMNRNEARTWTSGSKRKLAYSLLGSAVEIDVNFANRKMDFWRSIVRSVSGGFHLQFRHIYHDDNVQFDKYRQWVGGEATAWVSPQSPIGMLIVDVHDLDYHGRQPFTFY